MVTNQDVREWRAQYETGSSIATIAAECGVSYTAVRYHLHNAGVKFRRAGRPHGAQDQPIVGRWHWVTDGSSWWPAKRVQGACGGWSNCDTWEDFEGCVKRWKLITLPGSAQ